jgi:hypothetical protein
VKVSTPVGSPKVARAVPAITSPRKDSAAQNRAMSFMDDKDTKDDDDINMDEEEKYGADDSRKELEKEDEKASHEGSCFLLRVFFIYFFIYHYFSVL